MQELGASLPVRATSSFKSQNGFACSGLGEQSLQTGGQSNTGLQCMPLHVVRTTEAPAVLVDMDMRAWHCTGLCQ